MPAKYENPRDVMAMVGARVTVPHKMLLFEEAMKNGIGISEYLSWVLTRHCAGLEKGVKDVIRYTETEKKAPAPEKVKEVIKEVIKVVKVKEVVQTPKEPIVLKVAEVIKEKPVPVKSLRGEIIARASGKGGKTDWDEVKRLTDEAGLNNKK